MLLEKIKYKLSNIIKPSARRLGNIHVNWGYFLFTFFVTVAIILLGSNIYRIIKKGYERYEIINAEQARLDELIAKNLILEEDLKYYSSKEYIDLIAREQFNYVRPGQHLAYTIKEIEYYEKKQPEEVKELPEPGWRNWLELLQE